MTARDCLANDILAHELGHNMSAAHDRATGAPACLPTHTAIALLFPVHTQPSLDIMGAGHIQLVVTGIPL
ncbi:MAG: hypothetical protein HP494_03280 [Nitrospira sp.]|nr:hypothetical protein [Nitrospira sp.]MBH0194625.1 hypothetical protein [Nitrospira sp.]